MAVLGLDRQLCFALYSASRAMTAAYRPILTALNLTYPQYLVLLVLWEEGRITVGRLGERLQLDSGTLSPLLKRMEAAGLVDRTRDPADERRVLVALTGAGRTRLTAVADLPRTIAARSGLSHAQLAELRSTLDQLTATLETDTRR
jgi:MarR family transcriptional regulator, organic hydroperoxide resistance regulator